VADNDTFNDLVIDRAYDLLCNELDHWQIVGPDNRGAYVAQRWQEPRGFAKQKPAAIIIPGQEQQQQAGVISYVLKDKAYATACLHWHALQAVLNNLVSEGYIALPS